MPLRRCPMNFSMCCSPPSDVVTISSNRFSQESNRSASGEMEGSHSLMSRRARRISTSALLDAVVEDDVDATDDDDEAAEDVGKNDDVDGPSPVDDDRRSVEVAVAEELVE